MWGTKPPDMAWWIATGGGQFGHKFTKTTTFTRETFKPEFLW